MKRGQHAFWLVALLTSCAVSSFSIVDELPGSAAGAAGDSAGSANAGRSSGGEVSGGGGGSATAGSETAQGGKSQGGQTTQGGSAPQAGVAPAGDAGEATGGVGEAGAPAVVAPKPCDAEAGVAPILCDDFEQGFAAAKWNAPAGVAPEAMIGPHGGNTRVAHLTNGQQLESLVASFGVDDATAKVTVSFWFKLVADQGLDAPLVQFQSKQNVPIRLAIEKGLYWSGQNNARAPTLSNNGNIPIGQWHCVSILVTKVNMNFSYFSAAAPLKVTTVVVDDTPTVNVDDQWINGQPEPIRKILGHPAFGSDPSRPSDVAFDDIRIIHGTTNVCGL